MPFIFLAVSILLFLLIWPYWRRAYRLKLWKHTYNLQYHYPIFQKIVQPFDGFSLSRIARLQHDAMEYTYGEIEFTSFIALIAMTFPSPTTRFYDLGSGSGKAILAAAMVFDMQYYCGIELFNGLHDAALAQKKLLEQQSEYKKRAEKIHFINNNFLNVDLHQATLIFINATALIGPTWDLLNQKLSNESNECMIIITTSKALKIPSFIITKTTKVIMSWGIVQAYIHRSLPTSH